MLLAPCMKCMPLSDVRAPETASFLQPIQVRADPDGLAFDPRTRALYVADSYAGAISSVLGEQQRRIATIESGGVIGARIGGIALTPYGTLFATRIGHGRAGAILQVEPDGRQTVLPNISVELRRGSVTYDAGEHALYATQYRSSGSGAFDGAVIVIDLASGQPSMVLDGFLEPVGIAKLGATLVIADARQRAVFRVEMIAGRAVRRLQLAGYVDRPYAVCPFRNDSVLVSTYDERAQRGALRRIWLDGRLHTIAAGPWEPRGVATDGERAFVAIRRGGQLMVSVVEPLDL